MHNSKARPRVLIIAYGNRLRSDDGVAWSAADLLQARLSSPQVEILRRQQLGPELAEDLRHVDGVVFVDAAVREGARAGDAGEIRVERIASANTSTALRFSHSLSPAAVIALATQLYDAQPEAWAATVTGQDFDHGESLSRAVAAALPSLVTRIEALVRGFLTRTSRSITTKDPKEHEENPAMTG